MMLSEAFNYDTIFNELKEVSPGPLLPPQTNAVAYSTEPPQTKHPLPVVEDEEDDSTQPPSKRVRTSEHFLRIPCKARGMSKKHNSDTAYLDIPVDAPHGFLLSCSHLECAESGRKFRYCTVCASPVAKRNFPKRHGHGLIESAKDLKAVDYACCFTASSSVADASCYPCTEQTVANPTFEKPHHRRMVSYEEPYSSQVTSLVQQSVANRPATESLLNLSAKEQEWLNLLHERPNLEQELKMTGWMDKIICLSEEKECTLKKDQVAPIVEQPYFAPVSPPQQQRGTIMLPALPLMLPEPVKIEDEPASSPPTCDYFPAQSTLPLLEASMYMFDEIKPVEPSTPVDQFLQNLELEAPVNLDGIDLTNFFD